MTAAGYPSAPQMSNGPLAFSTELQINAAALDSGESVQGMNLINMFSVFRSRNYTYYTIGNVTSLTGGWIQRIALAWLVWELTESPFWLGLVAAAGLIPVLFIGPIGGVIADRFSQLKVIAMTQIAASAVMILLFAIYELELLTLPVIIGFRVVLSAILSISQPARLALIPQLVEEDLLPSAISFGAIGFNIARFLGPAFAGLIIATGDFGIAFLINGLSYLAMLIATLLIRIPADRHPPRAKNRGVAQDIFSAYTYVTEHPGIRTFFILQFFIVVTVRPLTELLPAFVDQVFDRGISGLAILSAAMAVGSILGSLWAGQRKLTSMTRTAIIGGALNATMIGIFVWIPHFWMAVPVIMLSSVFTVTFAVSAQTLVQSSVDKSMRGRVMGLWFVLMRAGPPLGALIMGSLTTVMGLSLPFTGASFLLLFVCWLAWRRRHKVSQALQTVADKKTQPLSQH